MEDHYLLQSLLTVPSAAATVTATAATEHEQVNPNITTNLSGITFRIFFISFIGTLAIWANHEASKGFSVTVVNDAGKHSLARKRFSLFYESNDKATRIVLNTSRFVENLLYPNDQESLINSKKQINGIILRLAPKNIPAMVVVNSSQKPHEYIITLNPSVVTETSKNDEAIIMAVLHGMARVWLWDGKGTTPPVLLDGMVEYISNLAGFKVRKSGGGATVWPPPENNEICWKDRDPRKVAGFLRFCDQSKQGGGGGGGSSGGGGEVVRRLNHRMSENWHDWMMDDVLGMAGQHACGSYHMMIKQLHSSNSM